MTRKRAEGEPLAEDEVAEDERRQERPGEKTLDALARMEREAAAEPHAEEEGTVGARWNVPDTSKLDKLAREKKR